MLFFARLLDYYVQVCLPFRRHRSPLFLFQLRLHFFEV